MSNIIDTTFTPIAFVDPFPGQQDSERTFVDCGRCGGTGNVYSHVDGGICYECNGHKGAWSTVGAERKRAKGKVAYANTKERKLNRRREFHNAQMIAAETAFPVLAAWHEEMSTNSFLLDLWTKAFDYELSDKQVAAAAKSIQSRIDRDASRQAERDTLTAAPAGKERISGTVAAVKLHEGAYGSAWKMIVLDARQFKVWATIPSALWDQLRDQSGDADYNPAAEDFVGRQVAFNATIEVSDTDNTFGFAKRPTKALLQAAHTEEAPEEAPAAEEAAEAPAAPATVTASAAAPDAELTHKDGTVWTLVKVLSETHYSVADSTGKVYRKRRAVFI